MRWKVIAIFALTAALICVAMVIGFTHRSHQNQRSKLVILTYPTFTSLFGPGPALVEKFQKSCGCEVEINNAGDSVVMLTRIQAEKKSFFADVVIGLDPITVPGAKAATQWRPVAISRGEFASELKELEDESFVPFDWSPMTFVYRKGEIDPPKNLKDLLDPRYKDTLALQDPRTSTPGLQFILWALVTFDDHTMDFFASLKPNVATLASSWSLAYGLFKKGQAKLAFSYETSVAFHWIEEKSHNYQAAVFDDGHPFQVEFAGIPANCNNCGVAEDFIKMLVSPEGQTLLMTKNYMFPVLPQVARGSEFERLPVLKLLPWSKAQKFIDQLDIAADHAVRLMR